MRKVLAVILVILIIIAGIVAFLGLSAVGAAPECPAVQETGKTEKQVGDALDKDGVVQISNGDATSIGRKYAGDVVGDLRVCFDSSGGHASGKFQVASFNVPFYVTASKVDLTGNHPTIGNGDLAVSVGSLPSSLVGLVTSPLTDLINDYFAKMEMKKKYSYELGNGVATVRAK